MLSEHQTNNDVSPSQQITILREKLNQQQQKYEELEKKVFIDPLTGLYNRTFWEAYLNNFIDHRGPIIVMSVDVDNLKETNDSKGHDNGDLLLKSVAGILKGSMRPDDLVARLGGDEFGIVFLLPENALSELPPSSNLVQILTDRIRQKQQEFNDNPDTKIPVKFSIGGQLSLKPPHTIAQMCTDADKQMYIDKNSRKNGHVKFLHTLGKYPTPDSVTE